MVCVGAIVNCRLVTCKVVTLKAQVESRQKKAHALSLCISDTLKSHEKSAPDIGCSGTVAKLYSLNWREKLHYAISD